MTRTVNFDEVEVAGAMEIRFFDVDITSYESGTGESFTPAEVGMNRFQYVQVQVTGGSSSDNRIARFDRENNRIRVYDVGGTEVAANEGDITLRVQATGR